MGPSQAVNNHSKSKQSPGTGVNDVPGLHLGGAEGIRTPGLLIANETRYQLRHSPQCEPKSSKGAAMLRFGHLIWLLADCAP